MWRWVLLFVSFLSVGAIAQAQAQAQMPPPPQASQTIAPIYTWKTDSHYVGKGKSQKFDFCITQNMLDNGASLKIALNKIGQKSLVLGFPQTKLQLNDKYPLMWQVDDQTAFKVVARATTEQALTFVLSDGQWQQLATGQNLSLIGPNDRINIELVGVEGAIMAVQDCVQVRGGVDVPNSLAAPKVPVAEIDDTTLPPMPEEKADSNNTPTTLSDNLVQRFVQAQLPPQQVVVVPPSQRHKLPLNFVWDVDDLFVGYKAQKGAVEDFAGFMQHYLQGLKNLCAGQIRAEVGKGGVNKKAQTAFQAVDLACDHQGQITVTALLFENAQKQHHVFFVEAPANDGAQALKARDRLMK